MAAHCVLCFILALSGAAWSQGSLKQVPVPQPPGIAKYVRSTDALIVLSKALFWDMQTGSDGRVACASCHFQAGADHRTQNQLSNPIGSFTTLRALNLNDDERASLVAFLKALTDDRVRFERAPFDHPELCVSAGHSESVDPASSFSAADRWVGIPAVGRNGNAVPLQTLDELLRGVGADGSRAHTLTDACTI
jgi:hypothetical protein